MSVSTDAVLFYGYCSHEEEDLFKKDREDAAEEPEAPEWKEVVLAKRGIINPWNGWTRDLPKPPEEFLTAWYAAKKAVEAEFGVDHAYHCHSEAGMPYIFVTASKITAWRGDPKPIESLVVGSDWNERLRLWCTELGVTPPQEEPQWWLVSYWS